MSSRHTIETAEDLYYRRVTAIHTAAEIGRINLKEAGFLLREAEIDFHIHRAKELAQERNSKMTTMHYNEAIRNYLDLELTVNSLPREMCGRYLPVIEKHERNIQSATEEISHCMRGAHA